jgi:hypothetical protein
MSSGISAIRLPKTRHAPSFFASRRTRLADQHISLAKASGVTGLPCSRSIVSGAGMVISAPCERV